jgi:hypothetical protein
MREQSKQPSAASHGATGAVAKTSPDKKPIIMQENEGGENANTKVDKRRRKKPKRDKLSGREAEGHGDIDMSTNVKLEEREVKEEKPVKSRPLAPLNVQEHPPHSHATTNQQPQSTEMITLKQSQNIHNAPSSENNDRRSIKLEQKVEKQKLKLKEAEARAAADAERSKKDSQRIKELEESVKALESALDARDVAAEGVQSVVEQHLQVSDSLP